MSNEQILKAVIEKAIKNGFKITPAGTVDDVIRAYRTGSFVPEEIIFDHDFAKAFWGDRKTKHLMTSPHYEVIRYGWQFHLQQMVLEEDPIKYLEKFL